MDTYKVEKSVTASHVLLEVGDTLVITDSGIATRLEDNLQFNLNAPTVDYLKMRGYIVFTEVPNAM